jgi:hypothetical protein
LDPSQETRLSGMTPRRHCSSHRKRPTIERHLDAYRPGKPDTACGLRLAACGLRVAGRGICRHRGAAQRQHHRRRVSRAALPGAPGRRATVPRRSGCTGRAVAAWHRQDQVLQEPLVPNNSPISATPEEGRALAITLARHSDHDAEGARGVGERSCAHDRFGVDCRKSRGGGGSLRSPQPTGTGAIEWATEPSTASTPPPGCRARSGVWSDRPSIHPLRRSLRSPHRCRRRPQPVKSARARACAPRACRRSEALEFVTLGLAQFGDFTTMNVAAAIGQNLAHLGCLRCANLRQLPRPGLVPGNTDGPSKSDMERRREHAARAG